VNCCPSNPLSVSTFPLSCVNKLTVYTITHIQFVRGWVRGSGHQTDKHVPQSPFTYKFFRWRHFAIFALPSMSFIFIRVGVLLCSVTLIILNIITFFFFEQNPVGSMGSPSPSQLEWVSSYRYEFFSEKTTSCEFRLHARCRQYPNLSEILHRFAYIAQFILRNST
jgi:hypothetical protein